MGPIGSAVLTFIGYKHTDKQAKFIYRFVQGIVIGTWDTGPWIGFKTKEDNTYSWLATGQLR